jgi:hypothetical protein
MRMAFERAVSNGGSSLRTTARYVPRRRAAKRTRNVPVRAMTRRVAMVRVPRRSLTESRAPRSA